MQGVRTTVTKTIRFTPVKWGEKKTGSSCFQHTATLEGMQLNLWLFQIGFVHLLLLTKLSFILVRFLVESSKPIQHRWKPFPDSLYPSPPSILWIRAAASIDKWAAAAEPGSVTISNKGGPHSMNLPAERDNTTTGQFFVRPDRMRGRALIQPLKQVRSTCEAPPLADKRCDMPEFTLSNS